jgi:hypothetical protein
MPIAINGSGTITGASTLATTVVSPTLTTATLTTATLTTPNIDSAQFATVLGAAPIYPCRAWVNFNGTGAVAIRGSGNVTSITDGGSGNYTVTFTTAMADTNYAVVGAVKIRLSGSPASTLWPLTYATESIQVLTGWDSATDFNLQDSDFVNVAVFR